MTDAEILALLAQPESDRVERKESFSASVRPRVYEAICAFANDYPRHQQPGVIVIGQRDDGTFSGLNVDDALLTELGQIRNNTKILPVPSIIVSRYVVEGHAVAVIQVEPSRSPPVHYDGRPWIRTGPTRSIATPEQELTLSERRRYLNLPFDAQPLPYVPLTDLDVEYFRARYLPMAIAPEVVAANHRDPTEQMLGLRMVDPRKDPTVLGVLLLGIEPQRWLGGAYVQFLRHAGVDHLDPITDHKQVMGRVVEVIQRVEELLGSHVRTTIRFADVPLAQEASDFPLVALRQLVRNAIMHRAYDGTNAPIRIHWFDDRIEIENPGGPYGKVTAANFGTGVTDYRNPNLAAAMRDLRLVEQFGQGLRLAQQALARNGSPPLEFKLDVNTTLVRIRRRP